MCIFVAILFALTLVKAESAQLPSNGTGVTWILANLKANKGWGNTTSSVTPFNSKAEGLRRSFK